MNLLFPFSVTLVDDLRGAAGAARAVAAGSRAIDRVGYTLLAT